MPFQEHVLVALHTQSHLCHMKEASLSDLILSQSEREFKSVRAVYHSVELSGALDVLWLIGAVWGRQRPLPSIF